MSNRNNEGVRPVETIVNDNSNAERYDMIMEGIDIVVELYNTYFGKFKPVKIIINDESEFTIVEGKEMIMKFTTYKGECRFFSFDNK